MTRQNYIFTSESVSEGHPDKVCDRISDAILDALIAEEPEARVACETFATTNRVVIGGEVGLADQDKLHDYMQHVDGIVRNCIKDIGYEQDKFHHETVEITNLLHEQSAHIAQGVDASNDKDEGAGDQGIMFGFATNETPELMPAPIHYAHKILQRLAEVRKNGTEPTLRPDAKSQLSLKYENGKPVGVTQLVLSTQHADDAQTSAHIREIVEPYIREVLPEDWLTDETEWWVNPTGKFVIGGPDGDAGLTGRKIIVDTFPLVVDPVCVSQSGHKLLQDDAVDALRTRMLPLADLLTPNRPEGRTPGGHGDHRPRQPGRGRSETYGHGRGGRAHQGRTFRRGRHGRRARGRLALRARARAARAGAAACGYQQYPRNGLLPVCGHRHGPGPGAAPGPRRDPGAGIPESGAARLVRAGQGLRAAQPFGPPWCARGPRARYWRRWTRPPRAWPRCPRPSSSCPRCA